MIQIPCREAFVGGAGKRPGRLQANLVVTRATSAFSLRLQYPHLDHRDGARWYFLISFGLGSVTFILDYLGITVYQEEISYRLKIVTVLAIG